MPDIVEPGQPPARPEDFVQSVGRALRVLEVAGATPGLPVKSIARRCRLNISTTYHLVRTLAYEGYLERLPDGTYVVGSEVARRFYELLGSMSRPPSSTTVLRHLAELTGLSVYLGRITGGQVLVEHGEFRDDVACAASPVPRQRASEPAWALVVSERGDDVPQTVGLGLQFAASDLAGGE